MKKKIINKTITLICCVIAGFSFASCSDWNDVESISLQEPGIAEQNPELYAQYLENLRNYKNSKHKTVYAWFNNSEKVPFNRGQHIDNVPDSVDIVILMHPDNLVTREVEEIENIRKDKGTKVIFTVNYDVIKLNYDNILTEQKESEVTIESRDFLTYMMDTLKHTLKIVDKYNYDGISIGYNGKSILHMTQREKNEYKANENTFIGIITSWNEVHTNKILVFEGKPQNVVDKIILSSCMHIILPTTDVTNKSALTYNVAMASEEGVPTDRFIVTAETPSLDQSDVKTGYWTDGSRAVTSSAVWAAATNENFTVAGLGIYNINNDYYNTKRVYEYTRKAIDIMNPSLKN